MRFWDSSALVPLAVAETHSVALTALAAEDPEMIVWWGSYVECGSAVHRLRREGAFGAAEALGLLATLSALVGAANVVQPGEELSLSALRLLAAHPLRAADALQLAAATIWARGRPAGHVFVSLDERLRTAALLESFTVVPAAV